jgi:uncharacterized membrane protein
MSPNVQEWLNLLVRWFHLIVGISWIGSSFYFMWLDKSLEPPAPPDERVTGEIWLVHSGGFYQVRKRKIAPGEMPERLHWFKWEAAFTWISGVALLALVFYMGGGMYLVDPRTSPLSVRAAIALGLSLLVASWLVYDFLCNSSLGRRPALLATIGLGLLAAIAWGLAQVLTGRAAYMHVGAVLGTCMVGNVWVRILPAQQQMIDATARGERPDYTLGERAKLRSVHNNYMTFPLLFIMLSNHFTRTYGHPQSWLILLGLIVVGAGVRHVLNIRSRFRGLLLLPVAGVLAALFVATAPPPPAEEGPAPGAERAALPPAATPLDPALAGAIRGVVRFEGAPPAPEEVAMPPGCELHAGHAPASPILASDGRLANVFVWIAEGLEGRAFPPPAGEVLLDQRGCNYEPHVLGLQVGQALTFLNSDPVLHNIHGLAAKNDPFNDAMPPAAGARVTKRFRKPEVMVRVRCDVHPWMAAFVGVVPHPFFAVTGASGEFALEGVPPGEYVVEAWHEVLGRRRQRVSLAARAEARADFSFAER